MLNEFRCKVCNRLLAKLTDESVVETKCPRCKTLTSYEKGEIIVREIKNESIERIRNFNSRREENG